MPTKDRLSELQQAFTSIDMDKSNGKAGKKSNEEKNIQKMFDKFEIVKQWISAIEENTQICEGILNNSFSNTSTEYQNRLRMQLKNSETVSYNIATTLKQLKDNLNKTDKNSADYRMQLVLFNNISVKFRNALEEHQRVVQRHRDMRKELLRVTNRIVNNEDIGDDDLEKLVDNESQAQVFVANHLMQEQAAREQLRDVEERHSELKTIESHLEEIRDLFIRLAVLVEEQQENIDRVEYHAMTAIDYVDNTVGELGEAERSKKKSYKKLIIIGVIVAVLFFIIIIILVS